MDKIPRNPPSDFDAFWQTTLSELAATPSRLIVTPEQSGDDRLRFEYVMFRSFGDVSITAYIIYWRDPRPRPLVLYTHGYHGEVDVAWNWAARGFNVCGVDLRGHGRSHSAVAQPSAFGLMLTGIESPADSFLRGAVCDVIRAAQICQQKLVSQISQFVLYGPSLGGALVVMAQAVAPCADLLVAKVPTLGWSEGRRRLVKKGSGAEVNRYIETFPAQEATVMHTLSYFDTMNFADKIRCPTCVGIGLNDDVVPPATVRAIVSYLRCPFTVRELPFSHSDHPDERLWQHFEAEWLGFVGQPPEKLLYP